MAPRAQDDRSRRIAPEFSSKDAGASLVRRDWLSWSARGLGATALLSLLGRDVRVGSAASSLPGWALPSRARRAVEITLIGGLSHIDSFDYKPRLAEFHGKSLQTDAPPDVFFNQVGLLRKNDWEFRQRGASGLWVSDLFPHIGAQADKLVVLRSMVAETANHTPALFMLNSGFQFNGYPALGSWLSYGLGSEADDLPAYVALADARSEPNGGASNWTSGFLPAQHQGVAFRAGAEPVRNLFAAIETSADEERDARDFLARANRRHREQFGDDPQLTARVRAYELAAQMQLAVPRAVDLAQETAAARALYGLDDPVTADAARQCLLGRRLLENGVRFVQIFSGGAIAGTPRSSWDAHEDVRENHGVEARRIDRPVAALLADLSQRGMLEDTLVLFTTEFGRTPFTQSASDVVGVGRDHNKYGFSCWLAGAGRRHGTAYGATDDIGWKVAERPVSWHDFHATVLYLMGIDHERLTYYHNGIQRRLTNVHGAKVEGIL